MRASLYNAFPYRRRSGTCRFHEIIRSGGQINVSDQDIQCDCTRRASKAKQRKNMPSMKVDEPEGILLRSQKLHDYPFPKSVLGIARAGAGTNNIPVKECTEQGIVVFNTPGANANAVKELVIASLLLSVRPILQGAQWVQTLNGSDVEEQAEANKSNSPVRN